MSEIRHRLVCVECGEFCSQTTETEEQAGYERLFPNEEDEKVRLCHTCWVKIMERAEARGLVGPAWRADL